MATIENGDKLLSTSGAISAWILADGTRYIADEGDGVYEGEEGFEELWDSLTEMETKTKSKFIVELAAIGKPVGRHPLEAWDGLVKRDIKNRWLNTFDTLLDAIAEAEKLKTDNNAAVMVAVIEWEQEEEEFFDDDGNFNGFGFAKLYTGDNAVLHCARGAKIKSIPYYYERPFNYRRYNTGSGNYSDISVGDWEKIEQSTTNVSVGGGNWVKFKPSLAMA
jgi:hypothetical protein